MTCQLINRISLAMPVDTCLPSVLMCFQMFSPAASNKYELFPASGRHLRCTFAVCIHGDAQRLGCQAATHLWRRYSFFYCAALIYIANTYIKRDNKIAGICVSDPPHLPLYYESGRSEVFWAFIVAEVAMTSEGCRVTLVRIAWYPMSSQKPAWKGCEVKSHRINMHQHNNLVDEKDGL